MTASRLATLGISVPLGVFSLWLYARYAGVFGPNSAHFMPHGYCYMWDPGIVWLHLITDSLIALSYYAIPVILIYFLRKQRYLPFNWIFWLFAGFILACGTTHLMEVWNIWHGDYVLAGGIKAMTAALSLLTAAMLIPLTPKAIALPALRTVNRELEAALKDLSEQKFALDQHAIVATTDVQGTITYANDKFCEISKYAREELIGQNHRLLNSGAHAKEFFQEMYHDIAGGRVWGGELRNRAKDGSLYWVDMTVIPFLNSDGKARQYMAVGTDITGRKSAEKVREQLAAIVECCNDAMISEDLNGLVTAWNRGAEKVYGYSALEVLGESSSLFIPPEREGQESDILRRIAVGSSVEHLETVHVRKDGMRIDVSATVSPIWSNVSEIVGASYITRDMTEQKRVAAKLALYTLALERSNQELDAFAYAASHDLKAPLRVIHNASTWIEEDLAGNLTGEIRENMVLLRSRVHRMDRLLDDLLAYSRIGRETDSNHAEAISGRALMENILGLLSPPEGFIVHATSTFAGIEVFRMPLQQILINLISNAIKHHDKKAGRIEVSVEDLGAMFRFSVKDDGPGIPAQYHEQIFRMFQTLKPRDQVEGSGMGLAMVRKHVDIAGGDLKLESAVGQGSTFSFTWPKEQLNLQNTKHKFTRLEQT